MLLTTRLYYTDADARSFDATVRGCRVVDGRAHVVLDRTAFYPTSGGQPHDLGTLDGVSVLDVMDGDDGQVVHVTEGPIAEGRAVRGEIDWPRRFDHMQQHTGQHILSAAFDRLFAVRTTSFHMGTSVSTIDLAREVGPGEIVRAEAEACRVVWEDRPVRVRFVSREEAAHLPLRKEPARDGTLRLVDVDAFDLSACGGTHVGRSGQVGVIAVSGWERFKGATRVSFVCGGRALASHGALRDAIAGVTRVLSVTPPELPAAVERLQQEVRGLERAVRALRADLAGYRAAGLRAAAETIGGRRVVLSIEPELDAAGLKGLAQAIVAEPGLVAVLAGGGEATPIVVARSAGGDLDASAIVRSLVAEIGGRGGGRPELAQAGVPASGEQVVALVRQALMR